MNVVETIVFSKLISDKIGAEFRYSLFEHFDKPDCVAVRFTKGDKSVTLDVVDVKMVDEKELQDTIRLAAIQLESQVEHAKR